MRSASLSITGILLSVTLFISIYGSRTQHELCVYTNVVVVRNARWWWITTKTAAAAAAVAKTKIWCAHNQNISARHLKFKNNMDSNKFHSATGFIIVVVIACVSFLIVFILNVANIWHLMGCILKMSSFYFWCPFFDTSPAMCIQFINH